MRIIVLVTTCILLFRPSGLWSDVVTSKDGEILKGRVVSESTDSIVFTSPFTGEVTLSRSQIAELVIDTQGDMQSDSQSFEAKLEEVDAPFSANDDESYDWIQLTSGEWLKGEIRAMYRNSIEFDSDELDVQEFDWEDISRIRTAKEFSVRIDKTRTRTGRLAMRDEIVTIDDANITRVNQFDLISIAPDETVEFNNWTANVSISSSLRSGNSEERDISLSGVIQKRTSRRRFYFDFLSNYSESNSETTSDDLRFNSFFDTFRTKKVFIRPISFEFFHDPLQNIDQRYTLGASLGYHLIDNRKTTWDLTVGPAYQRAKFLDLPPGEPIREDDPAIVLTSQFDTELTNKLDLKGSYKIQYANTTGGATYHAWTKFAYELTDAIDLDITLLWDRTEDPVTNLDGTILGNDDLRTTFGIGIEL